jgi:hypothetical protein
LSDLLFPVYAGGCPTLGCVFPPDQAEFLAGAKFDIRLEVGVSSSPYPHSLRIIRNINSNRLTSHVRTSSRSTHPSTDPKLSTTVSPTKTSPSRSPTTRAIQPLSPISSKLPTLLSRSGTLLGTKTFSHSTPRLLRKSTSRVKRTDRCPFRSRASTRRRSSITTGRRRSLGGRLGNLVTSLWSRM